MPTEARFRSLAVLHPTFESWGGAEWYVHDLAQRLARDEGVRVTLHTHRWRAPWGGSPSYSVRAHRLGGERSGDAEWNAIARRTGANVAAHDLVMLHNYPAAQWYARMAARRPVPPAVWYCHEPPRSLYGPRLENSPRPRPAPLSRLLQAAGVYRWRLPLHAVRRTLLRTRAAIAGEDRWRARLYAQDRAAVGLTAAIVANSRFTASRVERLYGRRPVVVYPVPGDLVELGPRPERIAGRTVLWVGRLTDAKRPLTAIDAWRAARSIRPELSAWSLEIVGDGPLADRLENDRRELERDGIVWRRSLPREELIAAYQSASLVLHLGLAEPLGLVPLEAMACGTPALVHAEGGVTETVRDGHTGWCVPELDASELATRLARLPDLRDELAAMGRAAVEHVRSEFDPSVWRGRLIEILNGALDDGVRPARPGGRDAGAGLARDAPR